jgi:hypothetical protein
MDIKTRYEKLFESVSSPKSLDCGRGTIYLFVKYCKQCGTGLKQAQRHDRREVKALFRKSFCSQECKTKGVRFESTFPSNPKSEYAPSKTNTKLIEEMAFAALEVERQRRRSHGFVDIVMRANEEFKLLSEKLSFLESVTGVAWNSSKFYYWLRGR